MNNILDNLSYTRSELMFDVLINHLDGNDEMCDEINEHIDIITDRITLLINPS